MSRPERVQVIAHRGASAYRPENTVPAYALAVAQGADMIEIDLHLSRDGEVVIAHDADLAHFGRAGEIGALTSAEIAELDAAHAFEAWSQPERVPTLGEVLDGFGAQIPFNLELKWSEARGDYPGLEARVLEAVEARGLLAQTLFSSFHDSILQRLRAKAPGARLAVLGHPRLAGDLVGRAARVGAEAVNPHFLMVDEGLVTRSHDAGLAVYVYTVNDVELMKRMITFDTDGLFTNHPDTMRALLPR